MDLETRRKISKTMKGKSNFEGKRHTHATKIQIGISQQGHRNAKDHEWVTDKETGQEHRVKGRVPGGMRKGRSRRFQEWIHAKEETMEVWDKPNPVKKSEKLSPAQKAKAKARAKAAGRPYPNMVDNIWAARNENFMDGRNPEDKGDMAKHGLKGKTIAQLKKVRSSDSASPREKQLAHWYINMHKEEHILEAKATMCGRCGTKHVRPEEGGTCPALSKEENARRRAKGMNESEDPREYDYEGDMAKVQLKSIIRNAQHLYDMLEDNTNLPEWVQSKITKAEDYLSGAHDYMMSKDNDDVTEDESSANRLMGTSSLADMYKSQTPGQGRVDIVLKAIKKNKM